jgi:hypothetical protein
VGGLRDRRRAGGTDVAFEKIQAPQSRGGQAGVSDPVGLERQVLQPGKRPAVRQGGQPLVADGIESPGPPGSARHSPVRRPPKRAPKALLPTMNPSMRRLASRASSGGPSWTRRTSWTRPALCRPRRRPRRSAAHSDASSASGTLPITRSVTQRSTGRTTCPGPRRPPSTGPSGPPTRLPPRSLPPWIRRRQGPDGTGAPGHEQHTHHSRNRRMARGIAQPDTGDCCKQGVGRRTLGCIAPPPWSTADRPAWRKGATARRGREACWCRAAPCTARHRAGGRRRSRGCAPVRR